jgi:hypothetical protein
MLRLKYNHPTNQIRQIEWDPVEIAELQQLDNKFMHTVYFWVDSVVTRFIIEFANHKVLQHSGERVLKGTQR